MLASSKGIVLNRVKYSDTSLIVKIFTEKFGTQSFIIKNAFSKKNKINYLHFAPLAMLDIHFHHKPGQIQFIKDLTVHYHYQKIPFDIVRNSIFLFLNETLYKLLFNAGEDEGLYQYIEDSLRCLDSENPRLPDFHIHFLINITQRMGFSPILNYSSVNRYFSIEESCFTPHYFENPNFITEQASLHLSRILQHVNQGTPFPEVAPKPIRNELLYALVRYIEVHISEIKKIESMEILAQILN